LHSSVSTYLMTSIYLICICIFKCNVLWLLYHHLSPTHSKEEERRCPTPSFFRAPLLLLPKLKEKKPPSINEKRRAERQSQPINSNLQVKMKPQHPFYSTSLINSSRRCVIFPCYMTDGCIYLVNSAKL
jgi:hypothetical protein